MVHNQVGYLRVTSMLSLGTELVNKVYNSIDDFDIAIRGTGDSAQDTADVQNATTILNSQPRGRLIIDGEVEFNEPITFTGNTRVVGRDSRALVKTTCNGVFRWIPNGVPSTPSESHFVIDPVKKGYEYFSTSTFEPTRGDYVLIYSQDPTGAFPHHGLPGHNYPAELHKIERWDAGSKRAYIGDNFLQDMFTNPRAVLLPRLLEDVVVKDITIEYTGQDQGPYACSLWLRGVNNARLENVHLRQDGGGAVQLYYAMNTNAHGLVIEGTQAADIVYGVAFTACNGVIVSDFHITGTRHAFTTTSCMASGKDRYGSVLNTVVHNGVVRVPQKINGVSRVGLDTHAEAGDLTFDTVKVTVGSTGQYGANARGPGVKFLRCTFSGFEGNGYGIRSYSPDTLIKGCIFENLWTPIAAMPSYDSASKEYYPGYANHLMVEHNTFLDCAGPALRARAGSNHRFQHNTVERCGRLSGASPPYQSSAIDIDYGTGHRVVQNTMLRDKNKFSVAQNALTPKDLYVAGNVLGGYGPGQVGFQDSETQAAMESAYAGANTICDIPEE